MGVWVRLALDASKPGDNHRHRFAYSAGSLYASNDVDAPANSLREGKRSALRGMRAEAGTRHYAALARRNSFVHIPDRHTIELTVGVWFSEQSRDVA